MPAPWRKSAVGRSARTGWPPVAAKTARPSSSSCMRLRLLRGAQRLAEIVENVARILEADREADEFLADAGSLQGRFVELAMGRAGRMNDQRLRVTHIGEMRGELQGVDELAPRRAAALHAEADH